MTIKAVLFDMDGVLLDAKEWHYEALNKALELKGYAPISRQDHLTTYDGLPTAVKLRRHLPDISEEKRKEINALKQELVLEIAGRLCKENPLHVEVLHALKQKGYSLAVCSNSIRHFVDEMMIKTQLKPYLDFFLSNQDVTTPKPNPEIYLTAIKRLGLNPTEVVICEDNPHGLAAAHASGAHVFQVKTVNDVCYQNLKKFIEQLNGVKKYENRQIDQDGKRVVRGKIYAHGTQHK
ncbi:HAD family hydrolase [Candidatus Avelusimicrobium caledoniensis]|uniref:HAD family hydrolase n=1 Tax=Candidatus Avelusimicrobium caledoniensis TaxID=3416220 RepID=UPI003D0A0C8E